MFPEDQGMKEAHVILFKGQVWGGREAEEEEIKSCMLGNECVEQRAA